MIILGFILCFIVYVGLDGIIKELKDIRELITEERQGGIDE